MGFQKPIENKLTPSQKSVLAKLSAIRNFQLDPFGSKLLSLLNFNPPESEQISAFDYLKKIMEATLGAAAMDLILKKYLDKVFDPNNNKLELMIIKAMAKTLDANGVNLSKSNGAASAIRTGFSNIGAVQSAAIAGVPTANININTNSAGNQSNKEWLEQNVLPMMNAMFRVVKAEIVKQIITMVFGPKEKMSKDPVQQSYLLNAAVCSSDMFSMSNPLSDSDGDLEFNKVELKQRLEKGEVVFTISCQDVKIKLPESILNQADEVIANNSNPSRPKVNPAIMFEQVNNSVTAEAQRINAPENANAVRKSFSEIMVLKVINLITVAIEPYTKVIFAFASSPAAVKPAGTNSVSNFYLSPCDIKSICSGEENEEFKKKTAFNKSLMNSMLALLLAMLLQKLVKEIKKMIKNYILKKTQDAIKRKLAKKAFISDEQLQKAEKAKKFAEATAQLNDIFKFNDLS